MKIDPIQEMQELERKELEVKSFSSPRLDALEKLYVRTYLHTLSHPKAYEAVNPGLAKYHNDNPYSRRENVQYHISNSLQTKAESLSVDPNKIIERLYHEALREGQGSNHAARIQALTLLGKHLGMFTETQKGDSYQINIVNYSTETSSETSTPTEAIESITENKIPEGIVISDYSSPQLNPLGDD